MLVRALRVPSLTRKRSEVQILQRPPADPQVSAPSSVSVDGGSVLSEPPLVNTSLQRSNDGAFETLWYHAVAR